MATYVLAPHELEEQRPDADTATVGRAFDASRGSEILEQRIVRYAPGRSRPVETGDRIAVLYVADARAVGQDSRTYATILRPASSSTGTAPAQMWSGRCQSWRHISGMSTSATLIGI